MHHTGGVVSMDPGEATPSRNESVRVLSPRPSHPYAGGYCDGLPIKQDLQVDVKMLRRQVVAKAWHPVDDLSFVQLLHRCGQLVSGRRWSLRRRSACKRVATHHRRQDERHLTDC